MKEFVENFKKFSENNKKYKNNIIQRNKRPNFWSIIEYGRYSYEIRYSRMLRWLLDPNENHNLKTAFSDALIEFYKNKNNDNLVYENKYNKNSKAVTEENNIDILYSNPESKINIVIELKTLSKDHLSNTNDKKQKSQLDKYSNYIKEKHSDNYKDIFFYITIDGSEPTIKYNDNINWQLMSYKNLKEILENIVIKSDNLDSIKIIKDFIYDIDKFILEHKKSINIRESDEVYNIINNKNSKEILENLSTIYLKDIDENKNDYYNLSKIKEEFENEIKDLKLNQEEIKIYLNLINSIITKQDHSKNQDIQKLYIKIFNQITGNKDESIKNEIYSFSDIFKSEYLNLKFNKIKISRQKQSFEIFPENEIFHIYIAGNKNGKIFNVIGIDSKKVKIYKDNRKNKKKITDTLKYYLENLYENINKITKLSEFSDIKKFDIEKNNDFEKIFNELINILNFYSNEYDKINKTVVDLINSNNQ